ncbi:MAG: choice-of-anchor J domain-containing protein [Sphingobacteriaceae bacterium]
MKKLFLLLVVALQLPLFSQIVFSEKFSGLTLSSYTVSNGSGTYTSAPSAFTVLNDGHNNNVGTSLNPNTPFNNSLLKTAGWVITKNGVDTFAVCTSWLDTNTINVDRYLVTPPITISNANTVLRWKAKSADANYRDGYEVFTTTVTGTPTKNDFVIGNRVFVLADNNTSGGGENKTWTYRSVNLDAYVGQTIRFAFRNNSKDRFQLWIDDIEVEKLSNVRDVAVNIAEASKYNLINIQDTVKATFTNLGAAPVTTLVLNYQVNNSAITSQTFYSTIGMGNQSVNRVAFAMPYILTSPGYYKIKTWVSSINGLNDQVNTNDTAVFYVSAQSTNIPRVTLLEQFISANNGDSPDAQERSLALSNGSLAVVNIHDEDSMKTASLVGFISEYKKSYSTGMIDRFYFADQEAVVLSKTFYSSKIAARANAVSPASISIVSKSYNSGNNQLVFTLKVEMMTNVKGDYRIGAFLTENNVYGNPTDTSVNGYNQLNDYYSVPWSPYYLKGYFVPAANNYVLNAWQYRHYHTAIHAFGGGFGDGGVIPINTLLNAGQTFTINYSLTLPTPFNGAYKYIADNIYIVGVVNEGSNDQNKRTILNVVKEKLTTNGEVIGLKENNRNLSFNLFPNPANEFVFIGVDQYMIGEKVDVKINDLSGREIYTTNFNSNEALYELLLPKLSNGVYLLELSCNGAKTSKKLIIQH